MKYYPRMLKILQKHKILDVVNWRDSYKQSHLHLCDANSELIESLLDAGLAIDVDGPNGQPIHFAARFQLFYHFNLLIRQICS